MKTATRTIEFWTPGQIDPASWSIMGINSKPNSDCPIGQYGTGLKYAIAVLLRLGHSVFITSEGKEYNFYTEKANFRGKEFEVCGCNGERLPFTTELGKHWEPWMAYRELVCNTMDENGSYGPEQGRLEGTTITITGAEIHECWENHKDYFCTTSPYTTVENWDGNVEFHKGSGIIFYRGVKVGEAPQSAYNYNLLGSIALTEDRTIKNRSELISSVSRAAAKLSDVSVIRKVFTNKEGWEQHLALEYLEFGPTVMAELADIWETDPHSILPDARERFKKQKPSAGFKEIEFNCKEKGMLAQALDFLEQCGYKVKAEIKLIENDNQNIIAFVHEKKIYLTKRSFSKGVFDLVQTMMEEHFHTLGYWDESRGFERFLMDQLIAAHNQRIEYPL